MPRLLAPLLLLGLPCAALAQDDGADPSPFGPIGCHVYLQYQGDAVSVTVGLRTEKKAALATKDLEQALSRALGVPLKQFRQFPDMGGAISAVGRAEGRFTNDAGDVETTVDLRPLAGLLRPLGARTITLSAQRIDYHTNRRTPRFTRQELKHLKPFTAQVPTDAAHAVAVHLTTPPTHWHLPAAVAAALLLGPLALLLWKRRQALRAADRAAGWFSYWRWAHWLTLATWLGWFTAVPLFELDILAERLLPGGTTADTRLRWMAQLIPPWVVTSLTAAISQDVIARLKGQARTARDALCEAAASLLTGLIPLLLVLLAVITAAETGLGHGEGKGLGPAVRAAVPWLIAALAVRLIGGRLARTEDLTPHAVTQGELRDRVFALAHQAGVKLTGLYVVPTGKMPEANAFAAVGGNVLLTDQLLRDLSRREVDAVVAHELAHLKYRHPAWMIGLFIAALILPTLLQPILPEWWRATWLQHLPIGLLLGLAAYFYMSRRFEFQTDAYAAWLTGDPEALITGLVKLHKGNLMPLRWGKWEEGMLTHPSTHQRLEEIARHNGVSRARLDELLAQADAAAEHYAVPAGVGTDDVVFTTAFRQRYANRVGWALLAGVVLTPALAAAAAWWLGLEGPARWAVLGGGAVLLLGVLLGLECYMPVLAYAVARRRLREKLAVEGTFVSLAPDGEPRLYEGFTNWDFGFLKFEGDQLVYVGEQTKFALSRAMITDVRLGPALQRWWPNQYLYVSWKGPDGAGGTFNLRAAEVRSMRQLRRQTAALDQAIRKWWEQPVGSEAAPAALPPPAFGEVTSAPLAVLRSPSAVAQQVVLVVALAAAASWLIGLPWGWGEGALGWYGPAVGVAGVACLWVPLWRNTPPEKARPPEPG